jgi:urease accessory protein
MGGALTQLIGNLGESLPGKAPRLPFACAFAVACANWRVPEDAACAGFAWAWCESQVAAAVKLVPLGHTAGQRLLLALGDEIGTAVTRATAVGDDAIGVTLPGLAIASALHETQYTRLFRS